MTRILALALAWGSTACNFRDVDRPTESPSPTPKDTLPAPQGEDADVPADHSDDSAGDTSADASPVDAPPTDAPPTPEPQSSDEPVSTTFSEVQLSVFIPYCGPCHAGEHAGEGVVFSSYDAVLGATAVAGEEPGEAAALVVPGDPDASVLFQSLANDWMPYFSEPLPSEHKETVRAWIAGGARP